MSRVVESRAFGRADAVTCEFLSQEDYHTAGSATMSKKAAPESGMRFCLNTLTA